MMVARVMPTSPPHCTSEPLRLLEAMSVPAAPAVAKKPTMYVMSKANTPQVPKERWAAWGLLSPAGALAVALVVSGASAWASRPWRRPGPFSNAAVCSGLNFPIPPAVFTTNRMSTASGINGR